MTGFVQMAHICRASPYVLWGDLYISFTEHSSKFEFNMQTYLTQINYIFEYFHASVIFDNVDVLYLEERYVCRPALQNNTATMFSSKNLMVITANL